MASRFNDAAWRVERALVSTVEPDGLHLKPQLAGAWLLEGKLFELQHLRAS
jgi:hypothetical protein